MSNVRLILLKSGDRIVGNVTKNDNGTYTIEEPLQAVVIPETDQIVFAKWLQLSVSTSADIKEDDIMLILEPVQEIIDNWNNMFGSGLLLPPEQRLITG